MASCNKSEDCITNISKSVQNKSIPLMNFMALSKFWPSELNMFIFLKKFQLNYMDLNGGTKSYQKIKRNSK